MWLWLWVYTWWLHTDILYINWLGVLQFVFSLTKKLRPPIVCFLSKQSYFYDWEFFLLDVQFVSTKAWLVNVINEKSSKSTLSYRHKRHSMLFSHNKCLSMHYIGEFDESSQTTAAAVVTDCNKSHSLVVFIPLCIVTYTLFICEHLRFPWRKTENYSF